MAATALGSGIAFLDSTVVNVGLPTIGRELHAGVTSLQWTLDAYLVTLTALLLVGGSFGDRYGRRRAFVGGLTGFVVASVACGLAPSAGALVAARAVQGVGAAFLVPGSLAIISATFADEDRSAAVGAWAGLTGVASAAGPLLGGWLIDAVSWRLIFLINVPLALVAGWIALRHVPETRDESAPPPDLLGAGLVVAGLAGLAIALIDVNSGAIAIASGLVGVVSLLAFVLVERRVAHPMLPLELFRSPQFTGANATTFAVYAGLGGALFLVVLELQVSLRYSALAAGGALLPVTVLMLTLSPRAGRLAQQIGPRVPMSVGPLVAALGLALFARVHPGSSYVGTVLPAAVIFGFGLVMTVAPLTAAVLGAVDRQHLGVGSATNNAIARLAGLLAVAILPSATGIETGGRAAATLRHGFPTAMFACAATCAIGGVVAFLTIRTGARVDQARIPAAHHPCQDPCLTGTSREPAWSAGPSTRSNRSG